MGKLKQFRGYIEARLAQLIDTQATVIKQTAHLADSQLNAFKRTSERIEVLARTLDMRQSGPNATPTAERLVALENRLYVLEREVMGGKPARDLVREALSGVSSGGSLTFLEIMELTGLSGVLVEGSIKSFGAKIERIGTHYRWVGDKEVAEPPPARATADTEGPWLLIPHISTEMRDAMKDVKASPQEPLVIFNKTTRSYECFDGTTWKTAGTWLGAPALESPDNLAFRVVGKDGIDGVDYLDTPNGRVKLHQKRRYTYGSVNDRESSIATVTALFHRDGEVELTADVSHQGVMWRKPAAEVASWPFEPAPSVGDQFRGRKDVVIPMNAPEGMVMRPGDRGYTCRVYETTDTHVCWSAIEREVRGAWLRSWDWTEEYEKIVLPESSLPAKSDPPAHRLAGACPRPVTDPDVRDPNCPACALLGPSDDPALAERERCARIVSDAFPTFPADPEITKLRGMILHAIDNG